MTEVTIKIQRSTVIIGGRSGPDRCYFTLIGHSDVSGEGLPTLGSDSIDAVIEYLRLAVEMERSGEA